MFEFKIIVYYCLLLFYLLYKLYYVKYFYNVFLNILVFGFCVYLDYSEICLFIVINILVIDSVVRIFRVKFMLKLVFVVLKVLGRKVLVMMMVLFVIFLDR